MTIKIWPLTSSIKTKTVKNNQQKDRVTIKKYYQPSLLCTTHNQQQAAQKSILAMFPKATSFRRLQINQWVQLPNVAWWHAIPTTRKWFFLPETKDIFSLMPPMFFFVDATHVLIMFWHDFGWGGGGGAWSPCLQEEHGVVAYFL